jgi:hypothetical protein
MPPSLALHREGKKRQIKEGDGKHTSRPIWMTSSSEMLPECFTCFTFLRSRGGSLSALRINVDAEGTTLTSATRFLHVSKTVTPIPL